MSSWCGVSSRRCSLISLTIGLLTVGMKGPQEPPNPSRPCCTAVETCTHLLQLSRISSSSWSAVMSASLSNSAVILLRPSHLQDPKKLNLAVLFKTFNSLSTGIEYVRRQPNGDLKVYCAPDSPVIQELSKLKTINGIPIQVSAPQDYKKGIISHPEINLLSNDDLQELLQGNNIASTKKISSDTALLLWKTDDVPEGLPQHIILGWETLKIRPYIRNPTRCYHCQKYGHVASVCRRKTPVCGRCAADGHSKEDRDTTDIKCAACHQCSKPPALTALCGSWNVTSQEPGNMENSPTLKLCNRSREQKKTSPEKTTCRPNHLHSQPTQKAALQTTKKMTPPNTKTTKKNKKKPLFPRNRSQCLPWTFCKPGSSRT